MGRYLIVFSAFLLAVSGSLGLAKDQPESSDAPIAHDPEVSRQESGLQ
jgi:hypothetical protein